MTMAHTAIELLDNPNLRSQVQQEFKQFRSKMNIQIQYQKTYYLGNNWGMSMV